MKQCSQCKQPRSLDEFGKNKRKKDGLQPYCKECGRSIDKAHYQNNPNRKKEIQKASKEAYHRNREVVWDYLTEHPCVDCGESNPIVLEFDHLSDKHKEISVMVRDAYSVGRIMKEISKCEVRCANCHKKKTAKQLGYFQGKAAIV